jgi:predicted RNA-binding protein with PIN domain
MILVDGYNVIHAWGLHRDGLAAARSQLIHILDDYAGYSDEQITVVFDGYRTKKPVSEEQHGRVAVVYTAYGVTADTHIQRTVKAMPAGRASSLRVVTADYLEQLSVAGAGAIRITPAELRLMIDAARSRHVALIHRSSLSGRDLKKRLRMDALKIDPQ